jgi:hypothetical protein
MKRHGMTPTWGSSKYQVRSSVQDSSISDSEDENDPELDRDDNRSDTGELNIDDILEFD